MSLTIRQTITELLGHEELSARDLAAALLLTPREVEEHLGHLRRSLGRRLKMSPAQCLGCGYTFKERSRLSAPGRCPRCKAQRVEGPWFRVEG